MGVESKCMINLGVTGNPRKSSKKGLGEGWDWIKSGESRAAGGLPRTRTRSWENTPPG